MTKLTSFAISMLIAMPALAGSAKGTGGGTGTGTAVPEIDALAGLAAVAVVGTAVALIWERRK